MRALGNMERFGWMCVTGGLERGDGVGCCSGGDKDGGKVERKKGGYKDVILVSEAKARGGGGYPKTKTR